MKLLNLKNKNGITLIALVITIIVLLILAGISISMLAGDNNILVQATNAKRKTEKSQLEESIGIAYMEYTSQVNNENDLGYYLNKIENTIVESPANDTWYVLRGEVSFTVTENGEIIEGKIDVWDGTSSEPAQTQIHDNEIHIYTCSELKWLEEQVNGGTNFEGYTVYLENNLDFGARPVTGSTEKQKWENETNELKKWTPIGITDALKFAGTFDGKDNFIKGIYVNRTENVNGLFGSSQTILNLTLKDSYVKGGNYHTGGIVGGLKSGEIQNVTIENSYIIGGTCIGGIIGTISGNDIKVENCKNENTTVILKEGSSYYVGGIVGQITSGSNLVVNNCSNTGNIIAYGVYEYGGNIIQGCGGIVGVAANVVKISNCINNGSILGYNQGCGVGGVLGMTSKQNVEITSCINSGKVTGGNMVGGIAGVINHLCLTKNCTNYGEINSPGTIVGGIVGAFASKDENNMEECYNSGNVKGKATIGGIIGLIGDSEGKAIVNNCYSKGSVIGTDGGTDTGAIFGKQTNTTGLNTLSKLFYYTNDNSLTAEGGVQNNEAAKIMRVNDDLTYEQFQTWIETQ